MARARFHDRLHISSIPDGRTVAAHYFYTYIGETISEDVDRVRGTSQLQYGRILASRNVSGADRASLNTVVESWVKQSLYRAGPLSGVKSQE